MRQERKRIPTPEEYSATVSEISNQIKNQYGSREAISGGPGIWANLAEEGLVIHSAKNAHPLLAVALQGTRSRISELTDKPILVTVYGDWLKGGGQRPFYYIFDDQTGLMKFVPLPEQGSTEFHLAINGLPQTFDLHCLLERIQKGELDQRVILSSPHLAELSSDPELPWQRVPDRPGSGQFVMELSTDDGEQITLPVPAIAAGKRTTGDYVEKYIMALLSKGGLIAPARYGSQGMCAVLVHPEEVEVLQMTAWKKVRLGPYITIFLPELQERKIPSEDFHKIQIVSSASVTLKGKKGGERLEIKFELPSGESGKAVIQFIPS